MSSPQTQGGRRQVTEKREKGGKSTNQLTGQYAKIPREFVNWKGERLKQQQRRGGDRKRNPGTRKGRNCC